MPVVTIAGPVASGAREVGLLVATRLGLAFVDQEVLVEAARSLGVSVESVMRRNQEMTSLSRLVLGRARPAPRAPGRSTATAPESALHSVLDRTYAEAAATETAIETVASAVQREQPDLLPQAAPDGTITLLFTDIENSTALNEQLGDTRWMEVLRTHNTIVREQLRAHGGYEVKCGGDGFMVAFGSARRAVQCAISIQRAFLRHNESAEQSIRLRIGVHTGEAVREADDFFGRHVNLAARIGGEARGGEILVSSVVRELLQGVGDIRFAEEREVELKGLAGRHRVLTVAWGQEEVSDSVYLSTIAHIVRSLAAHDNVLILGRGGQVILRDWPGAVRVLTVAPIEQRIEMYARREGLPLDEASRRVQESDRGRAAFHRKFYKVDVDNPALYHLTLNMGSVSVEQAANLICALAQDISV